MWSRREEGSIFSNAVKATVILDYVQELFHPLWSWDWMF